MNWLDGLTETVGDKVPKDFFTVDQISRKKNIGHPAVVALLKKEMEAGRIIARKYRINTGQKFYPVTHYGPK